MKKGETVVVDFPKGTVLGYLGCSGRGKQHGIEMLHSVADHNGIILSPINGKGAAAKCEMMLPKDPATLREVARLLFETADDLEKEGQ